MQKTVQYILVLGGAVALSTWLTAEMSRRKVNVGVRKFIVSTIGALALLLVWLFAK